MVPAAYENGKALNSVAVPDDETIIPADRGSGSQPPASTGPSPAAGKRRRVSKPGSAMCAGTRVSRIPSSIHAGVVESNETTTLWACGNPLACVSGPDSSPVPSSKSTSTKSGPFRARCRGRAGPRAGRLLARRPALAKRPAIVRRVDRAGRGDAVKDAASRRGVLIAGALLAQQPDARRSGARLDSVESPAVPALGRRRPAMAWWSGGPRAC